VKDTLTTRTKESLKREIHLLWNLLELRNKFIKELTTKLEKASGAEKKKRLGRPPKRQKVSGEVSTRLPFDSEEWLSKAIHNERMRKM